MLVVDEAQKIPDIGLNLKMIVDHIPGTMIVATGSSAHRVPDRQGSFLP